VIPTHPLEQLGFSIREFGSRQHQNGYGDGRKRLYGAVDYFDDDEAPQITYRQLVENGQPVPLEKQNRVYTFPEQKPKAGRR